MGDPYNLKPAFMPVVGINVGTNVYVSEATGTVTSASVVDGELASAAVSSGNIIVNGLRPGQTTLVVNGSAAAVLVVSV